LTRTVGGNGYISRSQSVHQRVSALVAWAAIEPQYVFGAAMSGLRRETEIKSDYEIVG